MNTKILVNQRNNAINESTLNEEKIISFLKIYDKNRYLSNGRSVTR